LAKLFGPGDKGYCKFCDGKIKIEDIECDAFSFHGNALVTYSNDSPGGCFSCCLECYVKFRDYHLLPLAVVDRQIL
jgi:hypothetical protein